jgi:hypothetical protein
MMKCQTKEKTNEKEENAYLENRIEIRHIHNLTRTRDPIPTPTFTFSLRLRLSPTLRIALLPPLPNPNISQEESRHKTNPQNRHDGDVRPHNGIFPCMSYARLQEVWERGDEIQALRSTVSEILRGHGITAGSQTRNRSRELIVKNTPHDRNRDRPTKRQRKAHKREGGSEFIRPDTRYVEVRGHHADSGACAGEDHHAVDY